MTTLGRAADGLWVSLDDGRVSTVQIPTALLSREFAEGLGQELADLINTALERFVARVRDDAVEGSADATVDNRYALESAIVAAVNDALVRHVDADSLPRDKRPVSHERLLELVERIRRHRRSR